MGAQESRGWNHQPKPKLVEHPKGLPYPQPSHKLTPQKPAPCTRHTEAKSSVEIQTNKQTNLNSKYTFCPNGKENRGLLPLGGNGGNAKNYMQYKAMLTKHSTAESTVMQWRINCIATLGDRLTRTPCKPKNKTLTPTSGLRNPPSVCLSICPF